MIQEGVVGGRGEALDATARETSSPARAGQREAGRAAAGEPQEVASGEVGSTRL